MKVSALVAATLAALAITSIAQAGIDHSLKLNDAKVGTTKTELLAQRDYSKRVIHRLSGKWVVAPRHATCWSHVLWAKTCDHARRTLLAHRWLYTVAQRKLDRLYPAPHVVVAPTSGHYAGWACITNGAYPGAPHEGDGVNGQYSGPLGMTTPWMGYYGNWLAMSRAAVYAIADRVAARYHYSYSFMAGQWPETYPPCASRF